MRGDLLLLPLRPVEPRGERGCEASGGALPAGVHPAAEEDAGAEAEGRSVGPAGGVEPGSGRPRECEDEGGGVGDSVGGAVAGGGGDGEGDVDEVLRDGVLAESVAERGSMKGREGEMCKKNIFKGILCDNMLMLWGLIAKWLKKRWYYLQKFWNLIVCNLLVFPFCVKLEV